VGMASIATLVGVGWGFTIATYVGVGWGFTIATLVGLYYSYIGRWAGALL
jgi:hypothetical protein